MAVRLSSSSPSSVAVALVDFVGMGTRLDESANVATLLPVRAPSLVLLGVMYTQIIFGALIRHKEWLLGFRLHVLFAFAVVAIAVALGVCVLRSQMAGPPGRRAVYPAGDYWPCN